MSNSVFPTLIGLEYPVEKTPIFKNQIQENVSGMETAIAYQTYPRYQLKLSFSVLRSDTTNAELQSLLGFFNLRTGNFDTFLFNDVDDNSVSSQPLGSGGAGSSLTQLVRAYGGFTEPVLAPNVVTAVRLDGVVQASSKYTVNDWSSTLPGIVSFSSTPLSSQEITADFTYYWPVRFMDPQMSFSKFLNQYWENKNVSLITVKNQ